MPREIYGVNTNLWPSAILKVPIPGTTPATGSLAGWVVPSNYPGTLLPGLTRANNEFTVDGGIPKVNLAPRFGFAWQPFGGNKFVLRGGYGFFYERTPRSEIDFGRNNGPPIPTPAPPRGPGKLPASMR